MAKLKPLFTFADLSQLDSMFQGEFLRGRREPRIAFVGRSNVGKSSLINALLGSTQAYVSSEPGKTRAVHFFDWVGTQKILADLPGYGFAKQSQEDRNKWAKFIEAYLRADQGLALIMVLLDSRHGPTDKDYEAISFLKTLGVELAFVMTKVDQVKTQSDRAKRKKEVESSLKELGFDSDRVFWVSVNDKRTLISLQKALTPDEDTEK